MSELELLIVDRARKSNPDLHRRTDGEIIQLYRDGNIDIQDVNVDDVDMTYAQGDFNVKPQYRIRDQLAKDFSRDGIPKYFFIGLGDTYNQFRKSPLGKGIGSIKNFATDIAGKGIDLGKIAMSGIGNAIMPGLGFVLSNLPKESARNKFDRSFTVGGVNMPNDPYGYYDALRAGNLNQDPFGRNPVSLFGNYMGTLAKDANYTGTNKFNLDKKNMGIDKQNSFWSIFLNDNEQVKIFYEQNIKKYKICLSGSGSSMFIKYNDELEKEKILKIIPSNWRFFEAKPLQYSPLEEFV